MATVELAKMNDKGPAPGETSEQHAQHASVPQSKLWGLSRRNECILFYCLVIPSWMAEITAAAVASVYDTHHPSFIVTATIWLFFWGWAWLQTAIGMLQIASWVRDESNLKDRKQYLYLAVRLNRLMLVRSCSRTFPFFSSIKGARIISRHELSLFQPTAIIAFVTFVVAYVRRHTYHDTAYWLIFLLFFVMNTVGCVMNAYNNIGWESDRLHYEEGEPPIKNTRLAMLGIPS